MWSAPPFWWTALGLLFLGLGLTFSKKGVPLTLRDWTVLSEEARQKPDALDESFWPEERLEHLAVMRDQGVLSEMEYEEKRKEILKEL